MYMCAKGLDYIVGWLTMDLNHLEKEEIEIIITITFGCLMIPTICSQA